MTKKFHICSGRGIISLSLCLVATVAFAAEPLEDCSTPVRPGSVAKNVPFWNQYASFFRFAPVLKFDFAERAQAYRYTISDSSGFTNVVDSSRCEVSLAKVWAKMAKGPCTVECEPRGRNLKSYQHKFRKFVKTAPFTNDYPPAARPYREAAHKIYEYMTSLPAMRTLVETGKLEVGYQHNAYPSKTHAAHIGCMLDWAEAEPENSRKAMKFAKASAEYLLRQLEPADAPLAYWPPTYLREPLGGKPAAGTTNSNAMVGNEPQGAAKYRGEVMLLYPADVAIAFVRYSKATGEKKFLEAAVKIAETYLKVRREDGTWPLKMKLATGETVCPNVLVPTRPLKMFETLYAATGEARWQTAANECFAWMKKGPLTDWNWDGQFEDIEPRPPYQDLTKHNAIECLFYILKHPKAVSKPLATAEDILRFSEDQFVFWEAPCAPGGSVPHPGANPNYKFSPAGWAYPSAFEQYSCYDAIDASAAKLIFAYAAMFRATRSTVYLQKAEALANTITRVQKENGRVPTFWMEADHWISDVKYDWLNCMGAAARALLTVAALRDDSIAKVTFENGIPKCASGDRQGLKIEPAAEKTPDGEAALNFTTLLDATKPAHKRQFRFNVSARLSSNETYRVHFWAKADRKIKFPISIADAAAPYRNYGYVGDMFDTEWKQMSSVFVSGSDSAGMLSVPFLMFASLEKGTTFTLGPITLERVSPQEMVVSSEWRPVAGSEHELVYFKNARIEGMETKAGTALDLSQYVPHYDIEKLGWLKSDSRGRLVAENAPDTPMRLRGFNCCYASSFSGFDTASKAEIEQVTERIRLAGINAVRLHFFDCKFFGAAGMGWYNAKDLEMEDVGIPETEEELLKKLDRKFLDQFHWLMKCLRDRGVYVMFDIVTSGAMMVNAGKASKYPRLQLFKNPRYRNHWKAAYNFWMHTVNPYTGKRPLDDPQYLAITFYNEQEHLFNPKFGNKVSGLTPEFREKYGADMPELTMKLLMSEGAAADKARLFMRERIAEMNEFYLGVVRASGYKGFVTNWDMYMRNLEGDARKKLTAVAMHPYHAHPGRTTPRPPEFLRTSVIAPWNRVAQTVSKNSSIEYNAYMAHGAATRVLGKPFFMTEFSHCGGSPYAQEAPVVQPAAMALQDWQLITPHANLVEFRSYGGFTPFCFDSGMSLMARVSSLAAAFGWQRGDIKSAPHSVSFRVKEDILNSAHYCSTIGCAYNTLTWLTRIGSDYSDDGAPSKAADLVIEPKVFASAANYGMWARVNEEIRDNIGRCAGEVEKLRQAGIIGSDNKTDAANGYFVSETGEIATSIPKRNMTVDAPRFQAAALKKGDSAKLSSLIVKSVSTPASILAISLDGEQPVATSKHMLLIVATRFVAEKSVWQDSVWDERMLVDGEYRQLMKSGQFAFAVKSPFVKLPRIYALNFNGTRGEEISAKLENGWLAFDLDTSRLKYGTPYFEIVE